MERSFDEKININFVNDIKANKKMMKINNSILLYLCVVMGLCMTITSTQAQSSIHTGHITVSTQAQVNALRTTLAGKTIIVGNLIIGYTSGSSQSNITNLTPLSNIIRIRGNLIMRRNRQLVNLNGLHNLQTIAMGNFEVETNNRLTTLDFPALHTIEGYFRVWDNAQLTTLGNFPALQSIEGHFRVWDNDRLTTLGNFSALRSISEYFSVFENNRLTTLGNFPALTNIGLGFYNVFVPSLARNVNNVSVVVEFNPGLPDDSVRSKLIKFFPGGSSAVRGHIFINRIKKRIYLGDITVRTQAELSALFATLIGIDTIDGNLTIGYTDIGSTGDITDLTTLSNIAHITKNLIIQQNRRLVNLTDLNKLQTIGGYFRVDDNDRLTALNFSKLQTIGGYFQVNDNFRLTAFDFSALRSISEHFSVFENDKLTTLGNFSALTSIGLGFYNVYVPSLFRRLRKLSLNRVSLVVEFNPGLPDDSVRSKLMKFLPGGSSAVRGHIFINRIEKRTYLGDITVRTQAELNALFATLISIDTIDGDLTIGYTDTGSTSDITDLTILGNMAHITGNLIIQQNGQLVNLTGLNNLQTVGGYFQVNDNDRLTALDFSKLQTTGGYFSVTNNDALTTLGGFPALASIGVGTVSVPSEGQSTDSVSILVENNPELSNCSEIAIFLSDEVYAVRGKVFINANTTGCNSPSTIDVSNIERVYFSDITVRTQAELNALRIILRNIHTIESNVTIGYHETGQSRGDITDLTPFRNIVHITGNLFIFRNRRLVNLNPLTDNLQTIGGHFDVLSNTRITTLDFPVLQAAEGRLFRVQANDSLTTLNFPVLDSIKGYVHILQSAHLNFPVLQTIEGHLEVVGNNTLNFPVLQTIEGYLAVQHNNVLTTLDFPVLDSIGGFFQVNYNDRLTTLNFPVLQTIGGFVQANDNPKLTTLGNFPVLQIIETRFSVWNNPKLTTLGNFPVLTSIGIESMHIPSLGGYLDPRVSILVENNPSLSDCAMLVDFLPGGRYAVEGSIYIDYNSPTCNSENEITEKVTHTGDITVRTQAEVDALVTILAGKTRIEGNLTIGYTDDISRSNITDLTPLSNIVRIMGNLIIQQNGQLVNLNAFVDLQTIGGYFYVYNNDSLTALGDFPVLTSIGVGRGVFIPSESQFADGVSIVVEDNDRLFTCCVLMDFFSDGVNAVIGDIFINDNAMGCNSESDINATTLTLTSSDESILYSDTDSIAIDFTVGCAATGWTSAITYTSPANANFITLSPTGRAGQTGPITLMATPTENTGEERTAMITLSTTGGTDTASQTVVITQSVAPGIHTLTLPPGGDMITLAHDATTAGPITFTLGGGATGWSAMSSNMNFITVPLPAVGESIALTVVGGANAGVERTSDITIMTTGPTGVSITKTVTITQGGAPPTLTLPPGGDMVALAYDANRSSNITFEVGGGATGWSSAITYTPAGANFITLAPDMNTDQRGTVTVVATPIENPGVERRAVITFTSMGGTGTATAMVTITQGGAPPTLMLTSDSVETIAYDADAASNITFEVGGGATGWSSSITYTPAGANFITFSQDMNTNERGTVTVVATPVENPGVERRAVITFTSMGGTGTATAVFTITQGGAPHTLSLTPDTITLLHGATTTTEDITVTLGGGASGWEASSSNETFITVPPTGDAGTIAITFAGGANTGVERESVITITTTGDGTSASETVTVTQGGAPHTLSLTPDTITLLHSATTITEEITVTLGGGASGWEASSSNEIFITVPPTGDAGTIAITLAGGANTGVEREAVITITTTGDGTSASEMVTVTQAGAPPILVVHSPTPKSGSDTTIAYDATINALNINFTVGGGAKSWTAEVVGDDNFLTLNTTTGAAGTGSIAVNSDDNMGETRIDTIVITTVDGPGVLTDTIIVTQEAIPTIEVTLPSEDTISIVYNDVSEQTITFNVGGSASGWKSAMVYNPAMSVGGMEFITLAPERMNANQRDEVTVRATPIMANNGGERTATIIFITTGQLGESATTAVIIKQDAAPGAPELNNLNFTDGDTVTIAHDDVTTVTSIEFTVAGGATGWSSAIVYNLNVDPGEEFITFAPDMGTTQIGDVTVEGTLRMKNSGIERTATITISTLGPEDDTSPTTATLTITQLGAPPTLVLTSDSAETIAYDADTASNIVFTVGGGATGWTAVVIDGDAANFLTLSKFSGSAGLDMIKLAVSENVGLSRMDTVVITTVDGTGVLTDTIIVTQDGAPPTLTLHPGGDMATLAHGDDASTFRDIIFTVGGGAMGWNSSITYTPAGANFITLSQDMNTNERGVVTLTANPSGVNVGVERRAVITFTSIGGTGTATAMFTITQGGAPHTLSLTPDTIILLHSETTEEISVTLGGGASGWSAMSSETFITVPPTGDAGTIAITLRRANTGVERESVITITTTGDGTSASEMVTVTQLGAPPTLVFTSDSAETIAYDAVAASDIVFTVGGSATGWTAVVIDRDVANFLTLSKFSGSAGLDAIKLAVSENIGLSRMDTVVITTVEGTEVLTDTIIVTQAGAPPTLTLLPGGDMATLAHGDDASTFRDIIFTVGGGAMGWNSSIAYTPAGANFITLSQDMNTNERGVVTLTARPSGVNVGVERRAVITFTSMGGTGTATAMFTITQGGAPHTLSLTPDTIILLHSETTTTEEIIVTLGGGASGWEASSSNETFITVPSTGDAGTIAITLAGGANRGVERESVITITTTGDGTSASEMVTVTQLGAPPRLTLSGSAETIAYDAVAASDIRLNVLGGATGWSSAIVYNPDAGSGGEEFITLTGDRNKRGVVTLEVASDVNSGVERSATITFTTVEGTGAAATATFTITQGGAPHTLSLSPNTITLLHSETTITEEIAVILGGGASGWSASSSNETFITVPSMGDAGAGTIAITLAGGANTGVTREAVITITTTGDGTSASEMVTITQDGAVPTLTLSGNAETIAHDAVAASDITLNVLGGATGWSSAIVYNPDAGSGGEEFITLTGDRNMRGAVTVKVASRVNVGVERSATITFTTVEGTGAAATATFTITQEAAPTIALSTPATINIGYDVDVAQTIMFDVGGSATGWSSSITYTPVDFITLDPPSNNTETGSVTVMARLTGKNLGIERSAVITIRTLGLGTPATATVTITQGGAPHTLSLTPDTITLLHGATTTTEEITVTLGGGASGWEASSSNETFITVPPTGDAGTIAIILAGGANTGVERESVITITTTGDGTSASETVTVTQGGAPHTLSLTPDTITLLHSATTITEEITVTLGGGASGWEASSSNEIFITVPPTGDAGTIAITLAGGANTGVEREAVITITTTGDGTSASEMVTVTQAGAPPILVVHSPTPKSGSDTTIAYDATINALNINFTVGGGAKSWTAEVVGDDNFLTLNTTTGAAGTGSIAVNSDDNMGETRMDTIVITTVDGPGVLTDTIIVTQEAAPIILVMTPNDGMIVIDHDVIVAETIIFDVGGSATGWTATSDNAFVTLSTMNGDSGRNIVVMATPTVNTGLTERTATITITTMGQLGMAKVATVMITQAAAPSIILRSIPNGYIISIAHDDTDPITVIFTLGGSATSTINTISYMPENENFITLQPSNNNRRTRTITLTPSANTSAEPRTAMITLKTTGHEGTPDSVSLTIIQGAAPVLKLISNDISIAHDATDSIPIEFTVGGSATGWRSRITYTGINANFITLSLANGTNQTGDITIMATPTVNTGVERTDTIRLRTTVNQGDPVSVFLTITQAAAPTIMLTDHTDGDNIPIAHDATDSRPISFTLGGSATSSMSTISYMPENANFIMINPENNDESTRTITITPSTNEDTIPRTATITLRTTGHEGTPDSVSLTITQGANITFTPTEEPIVIFYPNPTESTLTIEGVTGYLQMYIHDMVGRRVMTYSLTPSNKTIDVSDLPLGTYLVTVQREDKTWTEILMKK